ncbi:DEAD/DEAH box helicase [Pseudomonas huaxiensis]|uniref:DEAD/DEAH box helicase n=1 Tax=Pseudomonas huaxiensis TaxID=2213017 RepID=UPI000DA6A0B8|nr:DEAD/DEAH box helicase [Pseudomonas huaxiensis]
MDIFEECSEINDLITTRSDFAARNKLIKLLDYFQSENLEYTPLLNNLIRQTGLYPYLDASKSIWQDRYAHESFKVDIGASEKVTLHREQSLLLSKLLSGKSIAVSAPTSFGKSFVIDSFISIKKPINIAIIVPTIALTDETRRRLQRKFGDHYKIITTTDEKLDERNIFIFPQERAISYADKIDTLDMLVIDEFYKASSVFDKERSPALLRAILKLGEKSVQRYFLAPNIKNLKDNVFTKGMEFCSLDFNTVFLEKHDLYKDIAKDESRKTKELLRILDSTTGKTLIYAGTYSNIKKLSTLILSSRTKEPEDILTAFSKWLAKNYDPNWTLTHLVVRGTGIHNGQLHRSLSQIQIKLFDEPNALKNIISTSSIIEGVNTSAQNVVLWSNLSGKGRARITDFTYRNIIGRGGRMFRHFIGKIYILEEPPQETENTLDLPIPDEILSNLDESTAYSDLTPEQVAKIIEYRERMTELVGGDVYAGIKSDALIQNSDSFLIMDIVRDIKTNPTSWNGFGYLNSNDPEAWTRFLFKIIRLQPGVWGTEHTKVVEFVKILSNNWSKSIPQLLQELDAVDIGIEDFFKLERVVAFKLSALFSDVAAIQKKMLGDHAQDISQFISKLSHAFLPKVVYQLEEYGLPRSISKLIHKAGIIDFFDESLNIYEAISILRSENTSGLKKFIGELDNFDLYILDHFFEGVETTKVQKAT